MMKRGQGATEYAIFIAAVLAGLLALQIYYQRAVKGNMKTRADSVGDQFSWDANSNTVSKSMSTRTSTSGLTTDASGQQIMSSSVVGTASDAAATLATSYSNSFTDVNGNPMTVATNYAGGAVSTQSTSTSMGNYTNKNVYDEQ